MGCSVVVYSQCIQADHWSGDVKGCRLQALIDGETRLQMHAVKPLVQPSTIHPLSRGAGHRTQAKVQCITWTTDSLTYLLLYAPLPVKPHDITQQFGVILLCNYIRP